MRGLIMASALLLVTTSAWAQEAEPSTSSTAQATDSQVTGAQATDSQAADSSSTGSQATDSHATDSQATGSHATGSQATGNAAARAEAEANADVLRWDRRSGCSTRFGGLNEGPISLGYYEADMATGRRVCPRTEVSLSGRMGAIIDTPDFYGGLDGYALVGGSYAFDDRLEAFATLEAFRYVFITNAVIEATDMGIGQLTGGVAYGTLRRGNLNGAASARVMLPTEVIGGHRAQAPFISNGRTFGLELGHAFSYGILRTLEAHAYVGADVTTAGLSAQAFPRLGGLLNVGVQFSPVEWFGAVLDVNGRIGGYTSYLAPAAALRFQIARAASLELAASLPLAPVLEGDKPLQHRALGTDRHDALIGLRFGYRL